MRITIHDEPATVTLKLEGRIVGPWTAELDRTWHSLGPSLNNKKLSLDLRDVTYIDPVGRRVLADIYRHTHAHFEANSPLIEYFVQEAQSGSSQNGNGNGNGKANGTKKGASK